MVLASELKLLYGHVVLLLAGRPIAWTTRWSLSEVLRTRKPKHRKQNVFLNSIKIVGFKMYKARLLKKVLFEILSKTNAKIY